MSFFDKIWKEVKRPFNQADREISRVIDKTIEEVGRLSPANILGLNKGLEAGGDAGPLPIPDAPIAYGMEGEGAFSGKRKSIKSGRGGTILAGPLSPGNVGKKILG